MWELGRTEAVETAQDELVQAGSVGAGSRAGTLQGLADVLRTGARVPPPLDQPLGLHRTQRLHVGLPDTQREERQRQTISRAAA